MMSWPQSNPDGLYNYTVSYINAAYISFYNVDIHLYGGGGGAFFSESSHRVSLVQLLLYDNLCAMKIKDFVYKGED